MASIENSRRAIGNDNLFSFIFRKIKSFYAELLLASFLAVGVYFCTQTIDSNLILRAFKTILNGMIPFKMTGLFHTPTDLNGPTWYLSSMLIGLLITYPILKKFGTHPLLLGLAIGICGYLCIAHGSLDGVYTWIGITYEGNLRAIGELLLGAFAFPVVKQLRVIQFTTLPRLLCSLLRWGLLGLVVCIATISTTSLHGLALCAVWGVIVIAFSGIGLETNLFSNVVCRFLGAFSLPFYLTHRSFTVCMPEVCSRSNISATHQIALCFLCSVIAAFLVMYTARGLKVLVTACYKRMVKLPS